MRGIAVERHRVTAEGLRILVADEDKDALDRLAALLHELGHDVCAYAIEVSEVAEKIVSDDPELSMVVLHRDDDHALALIEEICAYASGPVIALTVRDDAEFAARAADRGIDAQAKPSGPEAVQSAIEVALRRHAEQSELTEAVNQLENALERRAIIERAKGILMERHSADERAAFELLRAKARSTNRSVIDLAQAVLDGHSLLPNTTDG